MPSDLFYIGTLHVELDYQSIDNFILVKFKIHFGFVISGWPVSQLVSCQDALTFQKFFNFPMVDLREDFTLGDLLHSIRILKELIQQQLDTVDPSQNNSLITTVLHRKGVSAIRRI